MSSTSPNLPTSNSCSDFISLCEKLDRFPAKNRRFAYHTFEPIDERPCKAITLAEQFHNTLLNIKESYSERLASQLFWEKQIMVLNHYAQVETDLVDVMISSCYEDDIYLINDKVVVMRPQYKASKPDVWAYVAIHEIGHHALCRGRGGSVVNRVNDIAFFNAKAAKNNSKTYQTSLFEAEVLAWHEGIKLAHAAGIHIVDKDIDRVKAHCLMSYAIID